MGALETVTLKDKFKVYIVKREERLLNDIGAIVERHKKCIIAFSYFISQVQKIKECIRILRKRCAQKVIFICGGPQATGEPHISLEMGFDIVVRGEAEETFINLLNNIAEQKGYEEVKGIIYSKKGQYLDTGRGKTPCLDQFPPFAVEHRLFGPIEITRGCPFGCKFCQTPYLFGMKPRHRSIDSICRAVNQMKSYGLTDIRFISPNAFSYGADGKKMNIVTLTNLLKEVRRVLEKKGRLFFGSFPSEVRPEFVNEQTIDLIKRYCDNDNIIIGAQSGSQRILALCNRGHTVEDVYQAVRLTLKNGLKTNVDFIFGLPEEGEEEISDSIKVMQDLIKLGARIHAHTFIPLPQTPFSKSSGTALSPALSKFLEKGKSDGTVFGDWQKQAEIRKVMVHT
ncbi:B12-binding domain/radical SAM domain-containing protein [candidate division WOR-3 bacterium 4484_100]|uniref:B12-binding domain/radical SAM domain-containing protein n=1 Tax=candidate division WOR-3 bacterium 4484_100 TaxID=1936077 RepID=A0A1V4QG29_UNCW3|nr:MAG: B12-binding domain/radical SAM domain-containing protein [candidate division WOR-3 bacterium 4484_100]